MEQVAGPRPGRSSVAFVGRRLELDRLQAALAAVEAGGSVIFLLGGEPGIGKSRLVSEFLQRTPPTTNTIRLAPPGATSASLPYAALLAGLRTVQRTFGAAEPGAVEAAALLDLLIAPIAPSQPLEADATGKLRLFESVIHLLRRMTAAGHVAVVTVDDLQWTDASTRDLLAYVAWSLPPRVLLCLTFRTSMLGADDPGLQLIADLERLPDTERIELGSLTEAETEAQIRSLAGAVGDEDVRDIHVRSGGNPLLAEELLAARGSDSVPNPTIASLLLARAGGLPDPARRLLQLASVAGRNVPAHVLEGAAGGLGIDVGSAARVLRSHGLLEVQQGADGPQYAFRHPIMQEVVYRDLLPGEASLLHGRLADEMQAAAVVDAWWLFELARHRWESGDLASAVPALEAAGDAALGVHAHAEAAELYERALSARSLVPAAPSPRPAPIGFRSAGRAIPDAPLVVRAASAFSLAGLPARAVELLRDESALLEDPRVRASLAQYLWEAGDRQASLALYDDVVAEIDSLPARARLPILRVAAGVKLEAGEAADALQLAEHAVRAAQSIGSDAETAESLVLASACHAMRGDNAAAIEAIRRSQELRAGLARRDPTRPSRVADYLNAFWAEATALRRAGRLDAAADAALEGVSHAERLQAGGRLRSMIGRSAVEDLIDLGRWAEARELADGLLAQAAGDARTRLLATTARLDVLRGDFESAADLLAEAAEARDGFDAGVAPGVAGLVGLAGAELALATDRTAQAGSLVDEGLRVVRPDSDGLLYAELLLVGLRAAAEQADVARFRGAAADVASAERRSGELAGQLVAVAARAGSSADTRLPALALEGDAEHRRADGEMRAETWEAVAAAWDGLGRPHARASAQLHAAEAHARARGGKGRAIEITRDVLRIARDLGALPLRGRADSLARRLRIDAVAAEPSEAKMEADAERPFDLSGREIEVLGLITFGHTNRQIAEALFITEKTAGHHVSRILSKLGVANRAEAAAVASRLRIGTAMTRPAERRGDPDIGERAVTMLFSDIVDSTPLLEAIGDQAWNQLVKWHDATLRALFASFGGREVDHTGDGFFVVFDAAVDAAECGVAIQRTLADHRSRHGFAPRVRMAVHRASVVVDGPRVRGRGVHVAARILSAANGDQILMSAETVTSGTVRGLRVEGLHTVDLRGLSAPIDVVELVWAARHGVIPA
jgi:class 3 adenylate cyclase/tetratricopeptide (TPR) repeat protein